MRVDERLLGIYDISVMHSYGVDRVDVFKHVDNSYKGVINMDNRLKEIRERLGKARKSPWEVNGSRICDCPLCDGEGQVDYADISGDGWVALAQTYGIGSMIFNNADFIANSPADIQFLLDVIEGQQRQLEDRLEDQTNACLMCDKMDMAMLESENEGLKQELEQVQEDIKLTTDSLYDMCGMFVRAQDRERVLREALQYIMTNNYNVLTKFDMKSIKMAREALKQEDKP